MDRAAGLRVASFNVRNGRAFDGWRSWPFRAGDAAAAVAALDADVVGLQEVFAFQLRGLRRRLPHLRAVGRGRNDGRRGEHCPLLWDPAAVRLTASATRWYGDEPDRPGATMPGARFPRIATVCRLEVPALGGAEVQLASTHLDAASAEHRLRSAEQLVGWLDPDLPTVVLGDLNARPGDPPLARLAEAGLRQALPEGAGGTEHAFSGRTDGKRIDHILVSGHLEVVDARVAHPRPRGRLPSDHWPVVADLRLADDPGPGPTSS
jgi:endonuclease/exonuclease/phosphatase family metal-dependent hydrolase